MDSPGLNSGGGHVHFLQDVQTISGTTCPVQWVLWFFSSGKAVWAQDNCLPLLCLLALCTNTVLNWCPEPDEFSFSILMGFNITHMSRHLKWSPSFFTDQNPVYIILFCCLCVMLSPSQFGDPNVCQVQIMKMHMQFSPFSSCGPTVFSTIFLTAFNLFT